MQEVNWSLSQKQGISCSSKNRK